MPRSDISYTKEVNNGCGIYAYAPMPGLDIKVNKIKSTKTPLPVRLCTSQEANFPQILNADFGAILLKDYSTGKGQNLMIHGRTLGRRDKGIRMALAGALGSVGAKEGETVIWLQISSSSY